MDNVYEAALDDMPNNEIRRGEITAVGKAKTHAEALNILQEIGSGVVRVEQDDDPANPGETAFFAVYE